MHVRTLIISFFLKKSDIFSQIPPFYLIFICCIFFVTKGTFFYLFFPWNSVPRSCMCCFEGSSPASHDFLGKLISGVLKFPFLLEILGMDASSSFSFLFCLFFSCWSRCHFILHISFPNGSMEFSFVFLRNFPFSFSVFQWTGRKPKFKPGIRLLNSCVIYLFTYAFEFPFPNPQQPSVSIFGNLSLFLLLPFSLFV